MQQLNHHNYQKQFIISTQVLYLLPYKLVGENRNGNIACKKIKKEIEMLSIILRIHPKNCSATTLQYPLPIGIKKIFAKTFCVINSQIAFIFKSRTALSVEDPLANKNNRHCIKIKKKEEIKFNKTLIWKLK